MKQEILEQFRKSVDVIGFASVQRFDAAPHGHHPDRICKNAKTVIVFGKAVPRGMLHSPDYGLFIMHRAYHSMYPYLDEMALAMSHWIEGRGNNLAVPIPSYAPMVFQGENRGACCPSNMQRSTRGWAASAIMVWYTIPPMARFCASAQLSPISSWKAIRS